MGRLSQKMSPGSKKKLKLPNVDLNSEYVMGGYAKKDGRRATDSMLGRINSVLRARKAQYRVEREAGVNSAWKKGGKTTWKGAETVKGYMQRPVATPKRTATDKLLNSLKRKK